MEGGNFLVSTRINLKKHEIKEIILKIQKTEKSNFIFISRKEETDKNPYSFFLELNINYNDALEVIKSLTLSDYKYSLFDINCKYGYLHVFYKVKLEKTAYIKIGFKNEKTVVISFLEKKYEN